mmetsp:Transcript_152394/g.283905  ORF Transcript_152394/g.283905 Transcript_152394/m.283905 type:complete len:117 (-) Transcript_152394:76-426(-)
MQFRGSGAAASREKERAVDGEEGKGCCKARGCSKDPAVLALPPRAGPPTEGKDEMSRRAPRAVAANNASPPLFAQCRRGPADERRWRRGNPTCIQGAWAAVEGSLQCEHPDVEGVR